LESALVSDEEDGLVWAAAAAATTEIIKKRRKILFILDLTALEARFRNLSLLDAKPPGERCLLFYREREWDGKKPRF
jgi:hypothetical protein